MASKRIQASSNNDRSVADISPTQSGVTLSTNSKIDYDKLANSIAFAETGGCKDGTAKKRNNCVGIMVWKHGQRSPAYFASQQDSIEKAKEIWMKSYKVYPTLKEASIWTGSDHPARWLLAVDQYYNTH